MLGDLQAACDLETAELQARLADLQREITHLDREYRRLHMQLAFEAWGAADLRARAANLSSDACTLRQILHVAREELQNLRSESTALTHFHAEHLIRSLPGALGLNTEFSLIPGDNDIASATPQQRQLILSNAQTTVGWIRDALRNQSG
eukprot:TRINITY_DN8401_c0_g1_i1.p1 TRINITY_DN8401_c0_g1~~TRINITY_DN8401_c0_g1_i1.p1  ORF type:complete len:149 (+),score=10.13 TRINITY_DN8401_c0_g1_i1:74-520(+)